MGRTAGTLAAIAALFLVSAGCGSPPAVTPHTNTPASRPTVSESPASLPTLTEGPISSTSGLASGTVVRLPDSYREHRMSSDGRLVVMDEIGSADDSLASSVVLVDLETHSWRPIAEAASGYHPWNPITRGDTVAWVEWKYASPPASGTRLGDL